MQKMMRALCFLQMISAVTMAFPLGRAEDRIPGPAVADLEAVAVSHNKVTLSWQDAPAADHYRVYRSTEEGFLPAGSNLVKRTASNAYQDFMLSSSTTYYYRVSAVGPQGVEGSPSMQAAAATMAAAPGVHPSVFFYAKEADGIRARHASGVWKEYYDSQKAYADLYVNAAVPADVKERGKKVECLCTAYLVGGDPAYRKKILEYMDDIPRCTLLNYGDSTLYVTYGNRAYGFAYDLLYDGLADADRLRYAGYLKVHAMPAYEAIDSKVNNWVEVMAGGLAVAGAAIRGIPIDGADWGARFMEKAKAGLERALADHVVGEGGYNEGESYVGYAFQYGSDGMAALRNVGVADLFTNPQYQKVMAYRTKNLLPMGNYPLFEDSRLGRAKRIESLSWLASNLLSHEDPSVQKQLQWLYEKIRQTDVNPVDKDVWSAFYLAYAGIAAPAQPAGLSRVDAECGLAYLRSGVGDEDLALSITSKPYSEGGSHERPDEGSFEIYGYGSYLVHQPGYSSSKQYDSYWKTAAAHNVISLDGKTQLGIAGQSDGFTASNGFTSHATGHAVEYVEADVSSPYGGAGSVKRMAVFVRPDAASAGYFLIVDQVTTAGKSSTLDWYLHGRSTDVTVNGNDAAWNTASWIPGGESVFLHAHFASPPCTITPMTDPAPEYAWGPGEGEKEEGVFLRLRPKTAGGSRFLTVLYPRKASQAAPRFSDDAGAVTVNAADTAFLQDGGAAGTVRGITSDSLFTLARRNAGGLAFYFVKDGSALGYAADTVGFRSSARVEMVWEGLRGSIRTKTADTLVTIREPSIQSAFRLKVDGAWNEAAAGTGAMTFLLAGAGSHEIEIVAVTPPLLTADTAGNKVGNAADLSFRDDPAWRGSIRGVSVDGAPLPEDRYSVAAGAIGISGEAFPSVKTYRIAVHAAGYQDATVPQTMRAVGATPALRADTTRNIPGNDVDLPFADEAPWRKAVTGVTVDGRGLPDALYSLESGNLRIRAGAFSAVKSYSVKVKAYGYSDAEVTQAMAAAGAAPVLSGDATDNAVGNPISLSFHDAEAWRSAVRGVLVDGVPIPDASYAVTDGEVRIHADVFRKAGNYAIAVRSLGYLDASVTQAMLPPPSPPTASRAAIGGAARVGETLNGAYAFADANGDAEGDSTFRWLASDLPDGDYAPIPGATLRTYRIAESDADRYIRFEVTPVSVLAPTTGSPVLSPATQAVSARQSLPEMAVVFFENFDDETAGGVPADLTPKYGANCSATVSLEESSSAPHSLKFVDSNTSGGQAQVNRYFPDSSKDLVVALKIRTPKQWMDILINSDELFGPRVYFKNDGKVWYYDGAYKFVCDYVPGHWYGLKLVIDVSVRKYDIYLDDRLVCSRADFHNKTVTRLNRLVIESGGSATATGIFVDDIEIRR